jgi:hypothetical protein
MVSPQVVPISGPGWRRADLEGLENKLYIANSMNGEYNSSLLMSFYFASSFAFRFWHFA